ncbi:hypothetical protein Pelo_1536 [Pelomyxa schiedti]|nr:hypothetical protein Pelo_1536 [Pelomyxa schiedti]
MSILSLGLEIVREAVSLDNRGMYVQACEAYGKGIAALNVAYNQEGDPGMKNTICENARKYQERRNALLQQISTSQPLQPPSQAAQISQSCFQPNIAPTICSTPPAVYTPPPSLVQSVPVSSTNPSLVNNSVINSEQLTPQTQGRLTQGAEDITNFRIFPDRKSLIEFMKHLDIEYPLSGGSIAHECAVKLCDAGVKAQRAQDLLEAYKCFQAALQCFQASFEGSPPLPFGVHATVKEKMNRCAAHTSELKQHIIPQLEALAIQSRSLADQQAASKKLEDEMAIWRKQQDEEGKLRQLEESGREGNWIVVQPQVNVQPSQLPQDRPEPKRTKHGKMALLSHTLKSKSLLLGKATFKSEPVKSQDLTKQFDYSSTPTSELVELFDTLKGQIADIEMKVGGDPHAQGIADVHSRMRQQQAAIREELRKRNTSGDQMIASVLLPKNQEQIREPSPPSPRSLNIEPDSPHQQELIMLYSILDNWLTSTDLSILMIFLQNIHTTFPHLTPFEIFDHLVKRYNEPFSPLATPSHPVIFEEDKKNLQHLVCNAVSRWIALHPKDFIQGSDMCKSAIELAHLAAQDGLSVVSNKILSALTPQETLSVVQQEIVEPDEEAPLAPDGDAFKIPLPPPPIPQVLDSTPPPVQFPPTVQSAITSSVRISKLLSSNPSSIVSTLKSIDALLWESVPANSFLDTEGLCSPLVALQDRERKLFQWVTRFLQLTEQNPVNFSAVLQQFVCIAALLQQQRDFSAFVGVVTALNLPYTTHIIESRQDIPPETKFLISTLSSLCVADGTTGIPPIGTDMASGPCTPHVPTLLALVEQTRQNAASMNATDTNSRVTQLVQAMQGTTSTPMSDFGLPPELLAELRLLPQH